MMEPSLSSPPIDPVARASAFRLRFFWVVGVTVESLAVIGGGSGGSEGTSIGLVGVSGGARCDLSSSGGTEAAFAAAAAAAAAAAFFFFFLGVAVTLVDVAAAAIAAAEDANTGFVAVAGAGTVSSTGTGLLLFFSGLAFLLAFLPP